jgi:hypothetical protein
MKTPCIHSSRRVLFSIFALIGFKPLALPALDCNSNGVPDELDVAPLYRVGESFEVASHPLFLMAGDLDGDKDPDS